MDMQKWIKIRKRFAKRGFSYFCRSTNRFFRKCYHTIVFKQLSLKAAALSYYTLLSIVPIIAIMIRITIAFEFDADFERIIKEIFSTQQEFIQLAIDHIKDAYSRLQGAEMAGFAILLLLWPSFKIFRGVKLVFRDIWSKSNKSAALPVDQQQNLFFQLLKMIRHDGAFFFFVLFISPIILVVANSLWLKAELAVLGVLPSEIVSDFLVGLYNLTPFLAIWLVLFLIFRYAPDKQVSKKDPQVEARPNFIVTLMLSLLTSGALCVFETFYMWVQQGIGSVNIIYGIFAFVPLFLSWIYVNWLIILYGAIVSHELNDFI